MYTLVCDVIILMYAMDSNTGTETSPSKSTELSLTIIKIILHMGSFLCFEKYTIRDCI